MESLQSGDEKADEKKEHIAQYRRWNCIFMLLVQYVFCK